MRKLIDSHGGLLRLLSSSPWTGATWVVDGNGRAYNVPLFSSQQLLNSGFTAWSGDNPTSWLVQGESGSDPMVTEVSGAARIYTSSTQVLLGQNINGAAGRWYELVFEQTARVAGYLSIRSYLDGALPNITVLPTTVGTLTANWRSTDAGFNFKRAVAPTDVTVDNCTLRELLPSSLFATVTSASPTSVTAKINALTAYAFAGVVGWLDSATRPANYIVAYHDNNGTVRLDKCVSGTFTNLLSVSVAFSSDAEIEIRRPSGNTFQLWYGGTQRGADQTISDAGIIDNTRFGMFSLRSDNTFTECRIDSILIPFIPAGGSPTFAGLFAIGDSKTNGGAWVNTLKNTHIYPVDYIYECLLRAGVDGQTTAGWASTISAFLATVTGTANKITYNLGANDMPFIPAEATWKANTVIIINAILAKWPTAQIYMARPWRRGYGTESNTIAGWIADIVALYPSNCHLGPDERVWLENGDDGATYTSDGIHYTAGGQTLCAAQWAAVMGY